MTKKRSVSIRGHRTSLSLEDAFWSELRELAHRSGQSVASLITAIDANRGADTPLSRAVRLYVLAQIKKSLPEADFHGSVRD